MNDQSSRSHAIFTLYIQQQRQSKVENHFGPDTETLDNAGPNGDDYEMPSAKFHFVDLVWLSTKFSEKYGYLGSFEG